jgi:hypothetical protein
VAPWVADTHGWVHHPGGDDGWRELLTRYQADDADPLARVFEVARAHRGLTVLEENRYVDADYRRVCPTFYRSEFSAFWSQRFPTTPAFARRLHFFRRKISDDQLHNLDRHQASYVGYTTLNRSGQGVSGELCSHHLLGSSMRPSR